MPAHAISGTARPTWAWCTCGQGFSGHEADTRLARHIDTPDPNSLGALLADPSLYKES